MGVVYRAEDPTIGRTVAIKTIRLGDLSDPSERDFMRQRLLREARSAGVLSHPGIVTIYDIAEEGDTAYIFMEYVNGETLEKRISLGAPLPKEQITEVLRQTAAALDYAHAKGIVHRDIKPANIMISSEGEAKVTDFGVAKILSQQMTQTRSILGTPYYMSPEHIRSGKIDGRADQFSLAVVAYELLTGERPYTADSLPALLFKVVKEMPPPPQRLNPSLAPGVETVFAKAFAKDPGERFFSCAEFVNSLALAASKKPDWKPLPRGASGKIETLTGELPPKQAAAAPASAPPGDTAVTQISPSPPTLPPPRSPRRREEEEPQSPSLARYVVMVVLLLALAAGGYYGYEEYLASPFPAGNPAAITETTAATRPTPEPTDTPTPVNTPATANSPAAGGPQPPPVPVGKPPAATPSNNTAEPPPPESIQIAQKAAAAAVKSEPKPPAKSPEPKEYWVQIHSDPRGAEVIADNDSDLACKTPCELPLAKGRHVLRLSMAGHRLSPRIIRVPDTTDVTVNLISLTGTLAVKSTPPGATILLNGKQRSEKTPALIKLPAGTYKIRLVLPGRPPFEDTVEVRDQVITSIGVDW